MRNIIEQSDNKDQSLDSDYWVNKIKEKSESCSIPLSYPYPSQFKPKKQTYKLCFSHEITNLLYGLTDGDRNIYSYSILTAIALCISRYGDNNRVVLGLPFNVEKLKSEKEGLLPVIIDFDYEKTFFDNYNELISQWNESFAKTPFSLEKLIDELELNDFENRSFLFNYVFYDKNIHNVPDDCKEDITFCLYNEGSNLVLDISFRESLYEIQEIENIARYIQHLLKAALKEPNACIKELKMLSEEETREILIEWNTTDKVYPDLNCIHHIFERQVNETPDNLAIQFSNHSLTYREFNEKANQFAHYLRQLGVSKETPVGIYMYRSVNMMIALYAVLKAGGAYVPLDPDYPRDRLRTMIQDISLQHIITDNIEIEELELGCSSIIDMSKDLEDILHMSKSNINTYVDPDFMAYIIYTSGSTGKPKGVIISHRAICNRLYWMQDYFNITSEDKILQKTPISFDVSVWELFWPLLFGSTVVVAEPDMHKDSDYLVELINKEKITTMHFVPSMLQRFLDNKDVNLCKSLKRVICSGEALERYLVDKCFEKLEAEIYNLYGPTEAAVDVTYWHCKRGDKHRYVPIGRPISNCKLYILDDNMEPVPVGVPGELYIGGVCLAKGYHNKEKLTSEKFVINNFYGSNGDGERLYKTGDWVRYRWDGAIEFLKRKDQQIKLRGFRIEIEEIESWIKNHPRVNDCAVTVYEDNLQEKRLVAYVVPDDDLNTVKQSEDNQVSQWKKIYDNTYSHTENETIISPMMDFSGWISSYTDKPIPQEEMLEWVSMTTKRIFSLRPKKVLEIGCGTGLLLYRIAPKVEKYIGVDLSPVVIEKLKKEMSSSDDDYSHVQVYQGSADDMSFAKNETFDCIIINSVIQLFPSIEYLFEVIKEAFDVLADNGCLFIGDVRDYKLFEAFHTSVQFMKSNGDVNSLKQQVRNRMENEKELLISPDFFEDLHSFIDKVAEVKVLKKEGQANNELTKYRYDVVIRKGQISKADMCNTIEYGQIPKNIDEVENVIKSNIGKCILFSNIQDSRTLEDDILLKALSQSNSQDNVAKLSEIIQGKNHKANGINPSDLYLLGEKYNMEVIVSPKDITHLKVVFRNPNFKASKKEIENPNICKCEEIFDFTEYSNNPLQVENKSNIVKLVKEYISEKLPNYMVPNLWMVLDEMPLSPNGKLSRKSLPAPTLSRPNLSSVYNPPETDMQKKLLEIWIYVLQIEDIGIFDSFFELGGHSLLALKLLQEISARLSIDVSLSEFLSTPTIKGLERIATSQEVKNTYDIGELPNIQRNFDNQFLPFELNDLQQAYFIGRQSDFELGNVPTHVYFEVECSSYEHDRFTEAVNKVIARHDMLRCIFNENGTQQVLAKAPRYEIDYCNIATFTENDKDTYLVGIREEMSNQKLDPYVWPLFDIKVTKINENVTRLHVYYDGLIIDAWSQMLLMDEVYKIYSEPCSELENLKIGFRDYLLAEKELKQNALYKESKDYWMKRITSLPEPPELPLQELSINLKNPNYIRVHRELESKLWEDFKRLSSKAGVTPFVSLLTAFGKVVGYWSRNKKFTLSIPGFNRLPLHPQVDKIVGEFASFTFFEIDNLLNKSFAEEVRENQSQFWDAMSNRFFNGVEVLRELARLQGGTVKSLMPVVFTSLLNMGQSSNKSYRTIYSMTQTSQVWIDAIVSENEGSLYIDWDCVKGLFDEKLLNDMIDVFMYIIEVLASNEEAWSRSEWKLLPDYQLDIYEKVNNTKVELPVKKITELLEQSLSKYPKSIAIQTSTMNMTYEEVFKKAKILASGLLNKGVKPNETIGIMMEKGWEQVIAVLGILYSGAAYLPIAADLPQERIELCLSYSDTKVVLTQSKLKSKLEHIKDISLINVDLLDEQYTEINIDVLDSVEEDNLAYVIYTSGSTGVPKGVMIKRQGLLNALICTNRNFKVTHNDKAICLTNLHHDMCSYDIIGMLIAGGTIVLPDCKETKNPQHWIELINKYKVTLWNSVPAMMEMMLEYREDLSKGAIDSLRLVFLGGDWINKLIPYRLKSIAPRAKLVSVGGPTETTLWNIWYEVDRIEENWRSIPYGMPIANTKYFILDENLDRTPIGVTGTMYCEGIGVAKGYINDPINTQKKFIIHPKWNVRLYNTGDLGRYMEDGNIEIVGREDFQVKINGQRIELGEIEYTLRSYPEIQNAVAVVLDDGKKSIAIYYKASNKYKESDLRDFMVKKLPSHMVPVHYIELEKIPLTVNGKVDRKALPAPEYDVESYEYIKNSKSHHEEKLINLYMEILNLKTVKSQDNFFFLGGNSLLAVQAIRRMRKELNIDISVSQFFEDSSIDVVLKYVKNKDYNKWEDSNVPIRIEPEQLESPLAFSQEGVWLIDAVDKSYRFTLPATMKIQGNLDTKVLERSLRSVVERHKALRTIIKSRFSQPVQRVLQTMEAPMKIVDLREKGEKKQSILKQYIIREASEVFDLESGPLFKFLLVQLADYEYVLLFTFHHVIFDEDSFRIFVNDLLAFYKAYTNNILPKLPEMKLHYTDFCYWQRNLLDRKKLDNELEYWREKLKGELKYLKLPMVNQIDRNCIDGSYWTIDLEKSVVEDFKRLCANQGITLFMGFCSVFYILLYRLTGEKDIIVGCPVSCRKWEEIQDVIGFFVNMLVLRTKVDGKMDFVSLVSEVQKTVTGAFSNQSIPFERILRELELKDTYANLPYNVTFNYIDSMRESHQVDDVTFEYVKYTKRTVPHDIGLFIENIGDECYFALSYKQGVFNENTVVQFADIFKELVRLIVKDPKRPIIEYLNGEENQKQIENKIDYSEEFDFNIS